MNQKPATNGAGLQALGYKRVNMLNEKARLFIEAYKNLCIEHGYFLNGCGCCDSPYLKKLPEKWRFTHDDGYYIVFVDLVKGRECPECGGRLQEIRSDRDGMRQQECEKCGFKRYVQDRRKEK